ncbi:SAM-dependent methyltransferase [hydrothermal vent metagenome]|uniref:SAM-dependent methyltransferase n=1 Tax=hydrothermal vent metagenome TaxID=652676 RepID=A0A3B0TW96_9ZZZZ
MKSYLKTKDFYNSQEEFELRHDEELDMLVTHPQPKDPDMYYQSENYISHSDANKTVVDKIYQFVKKIGLFGKTILINSCARESKTLLDVGAGTGDFLLAAEKRGWAVEGVEPSYDARMKAREKKVELMPSLESLPRKKYDVITLWHVLEHLPDLEDQILKLVWHLEEEGALIIAVPNFKSYDANHYKSFWAAYDVPRHLWHFSRTAINTLFSKFDMQVVKTKPLFFDAFYVALLSEKYKSGKQHFFKSLAIGLWSNLKALRTKEYSSIIYILKKH